MNIIVRKEATHAMFRPHMNTSMNKYYYTKEEYLGDLKRHKLEPYREVEPPKKKPYVLDADGRSMVKYAAECQKKKRQPSERFVRALNDLGIAKRPKWLTDAESMVGGFKDVKEDES